MSRTCSSTTLQHSVAMTFTYPASVESPTSYTADLVTPPITPVPDTFFRPVMRVRLETENSLWYFEPGLDPDQPLLTGRYLRTPKAETSRPVTISIEGRLNDGQWVGYEFLEWHRGIDDTLILRIKPTLGPTDGLGVLTSTVLSVIQL